VFEEILPLSFSLSSFQTRLNYLRHSTIIHLYWETSVEGGKRTVSVGRVGFSSVMIRFHFRVLVWLIEI